VSGFDRKAAIAIVVVFALVALILVMSSDVGGVAEAIDQWLAGR
jgi:hypothetical protein